MSRYTKGTAAVYSAGKIRTFLTALVTVLFIFSASAVVILHFRPLFYVDIRLLEIEKLSGMSEQAIRENYDALIRYNMLFRRGPLVFPSLPMSAEGEQHFREVKSIFDGIQVLCAVTGMAACVLAIQNRKKTHRRDLQLAGIMALAIPALLGALTAISWDALFIGFHRLVFRNDYWLFDPETDPVIMMLPDTFFLHCAVGILLLILLGGVLCLRGWRRSLR